MQLSVLLPILVLLSSMLPSILIFFLSDARHRLRLWLYLGAEVVKLALVIGMLIGIYVGEGYEVRLSLMPGIDFCSASMRSRCCS